MPSKVAAYRRSIRLMLQKINNDELEDKVEALLMYAEQLETASKSPSGPVPATFPQVFPSRSSHPTSQLKSLLLQLQKEKFVETAGEEFNEVINMIS